MKKLQKSTCKIILVCGVIISIFAAGIVFISQQQEEKRKRSDIVTIYAGDETDMYVNVDCYPVLQGQTVKVEDQKMIAVLSNEIDGKTFSYLGSSKELEKKFENISGGYYSNFSVFSENGEIICSFGYSSNYNGYIVSRDSYIYRLNNDAELDKICDEIIKLAKEQIE